MFRNIHVALSASSGNLRTVLAAGAADVKKFEKGVESSGSSVSKFADIAQKAVKLGALGLAAGLALSAASAISFEREMRNVSTLTDKAGADIGELSKQTMALATDPLIAQGPLELAKGFYDVASSGFQGAKAAIVLRAAAEAASAGLTTTAVSGKAITSVLNAYGRSAVDAADVSDVLFQTVNLGVITFEELASQLGDVVGTAAAAGVPIEQVGAAIAALTLSGISAAESTTSLNQVMQALIKPSDSMVATLKGLDYESGAAALKQDGLAGVMEKLRKATGGQLEAMALLFPEIRGLKGALALAAAEGENYRKTTAGIAVEEARAGATRKALAEQAKGVGFQLEQMRNRATVAAIAVGTLLLPAIQSLLRGLQDMATRAWPGVQAGFQAVLPLFRNLAQLGVNVVEILREMISTLEPAGKALLALVGGTVLGGLNALASVLADLTGLLADHSEVLTALAIAYGVQLVASLGRAALAFASLALERVAIGAYNLTGAMSGLAGSISGTQAASAGLALGLTYALSVMAKNEQQAKAMVAAVNKDQDLSSLKGVLKAINDNTDAMRGFVDQADLAPERSSFWSGKWNRAAKSVFQQMTFWTDNSIARADDSIEATAKAIEEQAKLAHNIISNSTEIGKSTGLTVEQVEALAKSVGVDLTKGFDDSAEAREKVILSFQKLQKETGLSSQALVDLSAGGVERMQALAAAVEETVKAVEQAFTKATSVFTDTGLKDAAATTADLATATERLTTAQDRVTSTHEGAADATERVREAERKLAEARKGTAPDAEKIRDAEDRLASAREAAAKAGATPAEIRAVANAERDLARARSGEKADPEEIAAAERELAKARKDLARATGDIKKATDDATKAQSDLNKEQVSPADKLRASFQEKLDLTKTFVAGIGELTRRGLDPGLIKQLLEQGPKDAAPTIQALLSDHTGKLIGLANETEVQLQAVNSRVVTFARLTQLAVSSSSDKLATDLPLAMKIAGQSLASEGKNTAEQIALAIGTPSAEVRRVATEYGITIGQAIGAGIAGGVDNSVAAIERRGFVIIPGGQVRALGAIDRYADGGMRDVPPHIATKPTILYGERSTGGEAFIPLGQQHRTRSTMLWEETGRILGVRAMAEGGVDARGRAPANGWGAAGSAGSSSQTIHNNSDQRQVNVKVEAPLDSATRQQIEHGARVGNWILSPSGRG